MNKQELSNRVAEKVSSTKKLAEQNVDAVLEVIQETLANGESVKLIGFGNFFVKYKDARVGRNPSNGEEVQIPAKRVPAFKAGKLLKDALKGV